MVNREATPVLYSNNRFRFPNAYTSFKSYVDVPYIAPFLQQIGTNASLLRHICIDFPKFFASPYNERPVLHAEQLQVFQLISETCAEIKTVELSCMPPECIFSLDDVESAAAMLDALNDGNFNTMPSLEKIIVVLGEYTINEEVLGLRDVLMQKIPNCKWSILLINVPPRVWISADDRVQFDNPEDCREYDNEFYEREEQNEQMRQLEEEHEEY